MRHPQLCLSVRHIWERFSVRQGLSLVMCLSLRHIWWKFSVEERLSDWWYVCQCNPFGGHLVYRTLRIGSGDDIVNWNYLHLLRDQIYCKTVALSMRSLEFRQKIENIDIFSFEGSMHLFQESLVKCLDALTFNGYMGELKWFPKLFSSSLGLKKVYFWFLASRQLSAE